MFKNEILLMLIFKIYILINSLINKVKKLTCIAFFVLCSAHIHAENISLNIDEGQELKTTTTYSLKENVGTYNKYSDLKVKKKTYYTELDLSSYQTPWVVECTKKKFDNSKVCYIKQGDLWIFLIDGTYTVSVGDNHYPKTKAGLRIDNGHAMYGYEGYINKPLSVIEKLKKGKFAYTRYQRWPYLYEIDKEIDLMGFTKRFNEMLKEYRSL